MHGDHERQGPCMFVDRSPQHKPAVMYWTLLVRKAASLQTLPAGIRNFSKTRRHCASKKQLKLCMKLGGGPEVLVPALNIECKTANLLA